MEIRDKLYGLAMEGNRILFYVFYGAGLWFMGKGMLSYVGEKISIVGLFFMVIVGLLFSILAMAYNNFYNLGKLEGLLQQILHNQKSKGGKK